jgi:Domain of unknown function (DUF4314)
MTTTLKRGDRLRLLSMPDDPCPIPMGAKGTVNHVANRDTDAEQVWIDWDPPHHKRTLMLLPGIDRWEVIP